MKVFIITGLVLARVSLGIGAEPANALQDWSFFNQRFSSTGHPPIFVTAYVKRSGESHVAAFKLTNLSTNPLTIYRSDLPLGNPHSLSLAAMTTDGQLVPIAFPRICAPSLIEVEIRPGQSMEGDYDLGEFIQFSHAPKGKDVVVIWAYMPHRSLSARKPVCTGVLVVPNPP